MSNINLILQRRSYYLKQVESDLTCYNPDTRGLIVGYLPKNPVIQTALHDLLASLYDKMHFANVHELPHRNECYKVYDSVKQRLVSYTHTKNEKTCQITELACTDIWASQFPKTQDQTICKSLLEASDRIEDLLFLADLTLENNLSEEVSHLGTQIEHVLLDLTNFTSLVSTEVDLNERMRQCFDHLKLLYQEGKYRQAQEKVKEVKAMIKV